MPKQSTNILMFLMVMISYIVLLGVSIYSFVDLDEDLPHDLPDIVLFIPAAMTLIVPLTYGFLLFAVAENHRPKSTALLGIFMALGLIGLSVAVYLFANA